MANDIKRGHPTSATVARLMDTVRGLTVWLAPAFLASISLTLFLEGSGGGGVSPDSIKAALGLTVVTLPWTVGGSALLTLIFAWSGDKGVTVLVRYPLLIVVGGGAGAVLMSPFGTRDSVVMGICCGLLTSIFWIATHLAVYRGK